MRRRRLTGSHESGAEAINVTPLIDVVMCLIIFFLIVGKLASERGMAVNLPRADSGKEESTASVLVITIARSGSGTSGGAAGSTTFAGMGLVVQVDGRSVEDAKGVELAVLARISERPETGVQVRADRDLSFGAVEPVLRAAGRGGAKSVRLAAERST